jgi:hypothetical protein
MRSSFNQLPKFFGRATGLEPIRYVFFGGGPGSIKTPLDT